MPRVVVEEEPDEVILCEYCESDPDEHETCAVCDECTESFCYCCHNCREMEGECRCCPECNRVGESQSDHECYDCGDYNCGEYGCSCDSEGCDDGDITRLMSYGALPGAVEFRSVVNGEPKAQRFSCDGGYPDAPDKQPYLGMEIENEAIHATPQKIIDIWSQSGQGWSTYDGSLSNGEECKTHPATYAWLRQSNLGDTLVKMAKEGARAWEHSSCGLHIHVSRKAFKSTSHQWIFAHLHVRRFRKELIKLAKRESNYAKWPAMPNRAPQKRYEAQNLDEWNVAQDRWVSTTVQVWVNEHEFRREQGDNPMSVIAKKSPKYDRSVAVNVEESTIELRYWKGSLNPRTVIGAAALEDALFRYSATLTANAVLQNPPVWNDFVAWCVENIDTVQLSDIELLCENRGVRFSPTTMVMRDSHGRFAKREGSN